MSREEADGTYFADSSIGIDRKLLDRTTPIKGRLVPGTTSLTFEWDRPGRAKGGNITISLASDIGLDFTTAYNGDPRFLTSTITVFATQAHDALGRSSTVRDPFESLSAMLSLIATANAIAQRTDKPLVHIVRANRNSRSFFERFSQAGLYYFSDLAGNRIEQPMTYWDANARQRDTLYACQMPDERIDMDLRKFVLPKAVGHMARIINPPQTLLAKVAQALRH